MARDSRRDARTPTGPGRVPRRTRTGSRPVEGSAKALGRRLPKLPNGLALTRRALILLAVLVVLALAYANSLRIYLDQQRQLALTQQQINERTAEIANLNDEIARWQDPEYVKAQARDRFGWVMPGEIGYRVLGPDGKPIGTGVSIDSTRTLPTNEYPTQWWNRMAGSIAAADAPTPAK
ncbi:MAG: septum formation initiator family protein [Propionibacteriaceae bacterium]